MRKKWEVQAPHSDRDATVAHRRDQKGRYVQSPRCRPFPNSYIYSYRRVKKQIWIISYYLKKVFFWNFHTWQVKFTSISLTDLMAPPWGWKKAMWERDAGSKLIQSYLRATKLQNKWENGHIYRHMATISNTDQGHLNDKKSDVQFTWF